VKGLVDLHTDELLVGCKPVSLTIRVYITEPHTAIFIKLKDTWEKACCSDFLHI